MKKLVKGIFISLFAIFLMSHNVSAIDIGPNAQPIWTNATPNCTFYQYQEGLTFYNEFYNNQSTFRSIYAISCAVPEGLQSKNTYAVYSFTLDNIPDDNSLDAGFRGVKSRHGSGGNGGWGVIGYTIQSLGNNSAKVDVYLYGENTNTTAGTVILFNEYNSAELLYLQPKERVSVSGASYWQVTSAGDFEYNYTDLITAINNKLTTTNSTLNNINNNSVTIRDTVNGISTKLDDMAQDTADAINDAQADATQDAADDSSTAGSSSSSDATSATSSLLSVIGAGIGAITTAQPTNCRINGDMGNLDVGTIDLCGNPVPTFISVIGSIIAVLVVLPLVIVLFNRFISIIRSFQT